MNSKTLYLFEIGKKIRAARKARKWSQETLAEHVNIHATYMSQIETGKVNLTMNVLQSIADCLGISVKELVSDSQCEDELTRLLTDIRLAYHDVDNDEKIAFLKAINGIIYAFTKKQDT